MRDNSIKYNGAIHALTSIIRSEGIAGLYRGLWPNLREFPFSLPLLITACGADDVDGDHLQSRLPRV